jgi:hypothetical protein
VTPPDWIREAVIRVCTTAGLDLGGIEYLESERDGQVYFYDINSLSNFVTDAPNLVGFDPFVRLGALVQRRWALTTGTSTLAAAQAGELNPFDEIALR